MKVKESDMMNYDAFDVDSIDICCECEVICEGDSKRIGDDVYCYYTGDHFGDYGCYIEAKAEFDKEEE